MANPNVFRQYLQPMKSVMDFNAEADDREIRRLQLEGAQRQNALQSMTMNQAVAKQNALQRIAASLPAGATVQQRIQAYRSDPLTMGEADAIEKGDLERRKTEAEIGEKGAKTAADEFALRVKKADKAISDIAALTSRDQAVASLQQHLQAGDIDQQKYQSVLATIPQDPAQFPEWRKQMLMRILDAKTQLEMTAPKIEYKDAGGSIVPVQSNAYAGPVGVMPGAVTKTQTPDSVASNATQRRGQDLTDARARERLQFDQSQPRGQFLETPTGYVLGDPRSGSVAPVMGSDGKQVQGKAADRALTDSQAKANLFGSRMQEADRIITSLEGKYSPVAVNAKMSAENVPLIGGAAGWAGNAMLSTEGQQAEQAQRDFINAVLRRESGAVISPSEFANGQKQYFPQPGDGPEVLAQKRRNRQIAIEGLMAEVPQAKRGTPTLTNPGGQSGATGEWTYVGPAGGK